MTRFLAAPGAQRLLARLAPIWRALPPSLRWRLTWLLTPKFSLGVTGIVFDGAGRVLLLRHTFRRRYPWGLVSGWVKGGESLEAALRREMAEETGFGVTVGPLFRVRKDRLHLAVEAVFLCRLHGSGDAFRANNEVTAARWCHPERLPAGVHPAHGPLIRAAAERLAATATATR